MITRRTRRSHKQSSSGRFIGGRRLRVECLEPRLNLTWVGIPPLAIAPPGGAAALTLNAQHDASGSASIAGTEVDYYSFTANASGTYTISATTPSSNLDTVLGVFSSSGRRLAFNDDISYPSNTDSRVTLNLTAGTQYYVGITNYAGYSRGSYTWMINGPGVTTTSGTTTSGPTSSPANTPTSTPDDSYEDNDSLGIAYNFGPLTSARTINNLAMVDSADWYRFSTNTTGTSSSSASISFLNSQGNLQLALYNASGRLLRSSQGTGNSESVSLNGLAAGTYYVKVYGNGGATNPNYTLNITPPTASTTTTTTTSSTPDDAYENNDTLSTAYNLGTLTAARTVNSLRMEDSADWFRFSTSAAGTTSSSVSISFQNSRGNLQLALYNSSGNLISSSLGTGNGETISLDGLATGTYYVDVYGANGATNPNYTLTVMPPTVTATPSSGSSSNSGGGFQITLQMTGLTVAEQAIFQQAADRWSQVITGDLPDATYQGQRVDDLMISASAPTIDGVGGILGQSGPDAFRAGSMLPIHGVMQFDAADMASMVSSGLLYSVVLHEMGHILGIGTLWSDFGLLSGAFTSNPTFTGANATAQYNQIFGANATGVPVEATGGPGTADAHWRETVFTNELMTGWAGPGTTLPLSRVTIGSLADLGYTVNYAAADSYTPTAAGLAAARSAASSGLFASRYYIGFYGIMAPQQNLSPSVSSAALVSDTVTTQQHQLLPVSHIQPIDQDIADFVMAAAGQTTSSDHATANDASSTTNSTPSDDAASHTSADDAWASLATDWNLWPALASA
ncbi:MAG TPA: pre-peptidase C-terminal domain-containing protein [Lacipirellulaceae bacterium]|nr:pre-peptidase C-terminal domain-containing protein [Lacipirellulaceae bacterium]